ncbi:MAG: hypothetical protein ACJATI_000711 [Halioglobus sp.]|jgi:hypothetical protein
MKNIFYTLLFILIICITGCIEDQNDIIPDLEGEPAAGIIDIDIESVDSNELIINVDLFAVDHLGGFIQNLGASNFEIGDNSSSFQSAEILDLRESRQEERGPFSATMLFDQSGSISSTDPSNARVEAGVKFAEIVNDGDEASVVAFTSGGNYTSPYQILTEFSDDPEVLIPPILDLANNESGGTPLYISAAAMCDYTGEKAKNNNKAIIAFTDGANTDSGVSVDQLIDKACDNDVRIYTVGLGNGVSFAELSEIAFETNGAVLLAENAIQLVSLYSSMGELLHGNVEAFKLRVKVKQEAKWALGQTVIVDIKLKLSESIIVNFPIRLRLKEIDLKPFYDKVPLCPCTYDEIPENEIKLCTKGRWIKCGNALTLETFHYGAVNEARWIPFDDDTPGQQCTYDLDNNLITGGISAGSPDKDAPNGCGDRGILDADPGHTFHDVAPWLVTKTCAEYLSQWPANKGLGCDENIVNGIDHMLKAVGNLKCGDVTRLFILADSPGFDTLLSSYFKAQENVPEHLLKTHIKDVIATSNLSEDDKELLNQLLINLG